MRIAIGADHAGGRGAADRVTGAAAAREEQQSALLFNRTTRRLHRARRELRNVLERRLGNEIRSVYSFHLDRCDRVVAKVFERIGF